VREACCFDDRADAGRQLVARLIRYKDEHPVVLGVPCGGVPVAWEVAKALDAPLDVVVARKIRAPRRPELGLGAVVDGGHPETVLNEGIVFLLGVEREYLEQEIARQLEEVHRRQESLRRGRARVPLAGRPVIVVDDGVATGATMRAALRGLKRARPRRVILAVGVAPPDTAEVLRREADDLVTVATPEPFGAVGRFYRNFRPVTDDEVARLLAAAAERAADGDAA
jgi:putative phosphoribosyl transferase